MTQHATTLDEVLTLRSENARLLATIERLQADRNELTAGVDKQFHQIERLRANLASRDDFLGSIGQWQAYTDTLPPGAGDSPHLAKVERLRTALEAVDAEIALEGQLKELVDAALDHEQGEKNDH